MARSASAEVLADKTTSDYKQLRDILRARDLFTVRASCYIQDALVILALLLISIGLLFCSHRFEVKLLAVITLSVAFTHIGFLIHDAGHGHIFVNRRSNELTILLLGFVVGVSRSWWVVNHNRHHGFTNNLDLDPHLKIPVLAFSTQQAASTNGILRRLLRYQHYYFFPLLTLEAINARCASVRAVAAGNAKYPFWEGAALLCHAVGYIILLTSAMSVLEAILFALLHQGLTGFYMALVFAPNHKAMPLDGGEKGNFPMRQLRASRNISPGWLTDWLAGGANYQIEHHLFPNLPRHRLSEARRPVREYCAERGWPYSEVTWQTAYGEILTTLRTVAVSFNRETCSQR